MEDKRIRPLPVPVQVPRSHRTKQTPAGHHAHTSDVPSSLSVDTPSDIGMHPNFHLLNFPAPKSGSSSSKLPLTSPEGITSPSSQSLSKTLSVDAVQSPPKLVDTPFVISPPSEPVSIHPSLVRSAHSSADSPSQTSTPSRSGASESEEHVGPTRASIRAWAKATPAGAPQGTPPRHMADSPQSGSGSGSDDNLSRASLTRSAVALAGGSPQSSADQSQNSSGDESSRNRRPEAEGSSGDVADVESSGSEPTSRSSPPLDGAARRESLAPHPHSGGVVHPHHHHPRHHAHTHQHHHAPIDPRPQHVHSHPPAHAHPPPHSHASSDSPSPPAAAATEERQQRHDRRQHRHKHGGRRRHRDRHPRTPPAPALAPLPPLQPPPPPLPRLRPLRVLSGNETDVFEEIVKMLAGSRRSLVRAGEDGWDVPMRAPREGDVLDDICKMIQWSREK